LNAVSCTAGLLRMRCWNMGRPRTGARGPWVYKSHDA